MTLVVLHNMKALIIIACVCEEMKCVACCKSSANCSNVMVEISAHYDFFIVDYYTMTMSKSLMLGLNTISFAIV
jgi:hypothetical protein